MATGQNKTFNAQIVGKVDIQAGDSLKVVERLLQLEKALTAELRKTANEAVNMHDKIGQPKSEAEFKKIQDAVSKLAGELKALGLVGKSAKLLTQDDVKVANDMERRVSAIAKAYESLTKQKKIEGGLFGMDEKDPRKAVQSLRELEKAAKATQAAMSMKGDSSGDLARYKDKIAANTAALQKHIDTLRSAITVEKAHEAALKANASFDANKAKKYANTQASAIAQNIAVDKARDDAEKKRLTDFMAWRQRARDAANTKELRDMQRQNEMSYRLINSGRAQAQQARTQLDFSATGRGAAAYQFQVQSQRASLLANPAYQAQDQARRQRLQDERALAEIYRGAGARPETAGFYRGTTDQSEPRRKAAQEILGLQQQLVEAQKRGVLTDQESLRLRTEIAKKIQDESAARAKEGNKQAQQNQAERNMSRVQGVGGASLMAVQASLMANYSIINGVTGTMSAAVKNSVDLEAAFRNVQAVTTTTSAEMKGLEENIKTVAATSKFSSLEVANAALTLGQAGMSAKEVGESISAVAMLAAASGTSLAQSVDLVTSIVGVFDKNANDTAEVANKITAAANNSKISVDKLALGFQYAGNTAAQSGVSFEETTAAMAAMSNAGIRSGSTMGTGLRQFLIEVQKPSEEFLKTIQRLGLNLSDLDFKSHGLIGVAQRLREAGFIATDAIKSFDVRGAAAFNAMIANPEDMEYQFRMMQESRAGMKAQEIQMNSLQAQTTRMTTSMTNLASVGFAPVSLLLQKMASGLADAAQGMSEYTKLAQVMGVVLASVVTTAMAAHILSLARGAAVLLGMNTAALTALRGLTLLGAGQAILTGLGAAWGTLRAAVVATGTAYTINAAAAGAATGIWATATGILTGAMTRLLTVVRGLTLGTGLGLAVTALSAGFFLMGDSAKEAEAELDGLRGKSDEAKGAFKTQQDSISSLTNRINELNYKQAEGNTRSSDLKSTIIALNAEFGSIGVSIDQNTNSYSRMIEKLKEARKEVRDFAAAKLTVAQEENRQEVNRRTEVVNGQRTGLTGTATSAIDAALNRKALMMPGQADILKAVKAELAAGKTPSTTNLENVRVIMEQVREGLKKNMGIGTYGDSQKLGKFLDRVSPFISSVSELQIAKGNQASLQGERQSFEMDEAYKQRQFTVGGRKMTLETASETLGGNLRAKAAKKFGSSGDRLKDFDAFKDMANRERESLEELEGQLRGDLNNPKMNTQVVMSNLTRVRQLLEGSKSEVMRYADETQGEALREYNNKKRILSARASTPGKEGKPVAARAIKDLAALEAEFKTRGLIDPLAIENAKSSMLEAGDIRADNKMYSRPTKDKAAAANNIRERVLNSQSAAEIRAAEAAKASAGLTEDLEYVQQLWDEGLERLGNARKYSLEALQVRQADQRKDLSGADLKAMEGVFANEVDAVNLDFDSRMSQFRDSFKGFGKAAGGLLTQMDVAIKKARQELETMKVSRDDKIYSESARLRDMELMRDLGKRVMKANMGTARYDYRASRDEKTDRDSSFLMTPSGNLKRGSSSKGSGRTDDSFASTSFGRRGVSVTNGMGSTDGSVTASGRTTSLISDGATLRQRISKEIVRIGQVELEENEKYLEALGDDSSGLIGQYKLQLAEAEKAYEATKTRVAELTELAKKKAITPDQLEELRQGQDTMDSQGKFVKSTQSSLNEANGERRAARKENSDIQVRIARNTEDLPEELSLENVNDRIMEVRDNWAEAVREMNTNKVIGDGIAGVMGNLTGNLGNSFAQILSGTKSISAGFRDMASSVIKSLLDIAAQAVAMQAFKAIVGMIGGSMGGGTASAGDYAMPEGGMSVPTFSYPTGIATGGFIKPDGKVQRAKGFNAGGPVGGAVRGRDSVPAMLMPGEFVLKQSAVSAVGTDYLHSLNQASTSVASSPMTKGAAAPQSQGPQVTNVWIVTPDQQPSGMGANDVVAVISDNITRGGSIKKLVKQVINNQV